jgi:hypothetical protein
MTTQLQQLNEEFVSIITHLFTRATSAFLIIFGRRETGKTDFSLLIAEILYGKGIMEHFATNIKIENVPFDIKHITNLDDLRLWCRETPGKKLFIFDEFGKAFRRRTPMSSLNVKLIDELQILRKHKLSTIAVTVDEKYIDQTALGSDVLDGVFIKPDYKNPKVALYVDNLEDFKKRIIGIPRTSLDFDTWDVAPFKEHGEKEKPAFKEEMKAGLWDLTHGKTAKEIGWDPQQVARNWRKFVKEMLEREHDA